MDATASDAAMVIEFHKIVNEAVSRSPSPDPETELMKRHFSGEEAIEQFPLTASPSILLHVVLSSTALDPKDLAALEASCAITFLVRTPFEF